MSEREIACFDNSKAAIEEGIIPGGGVALIRSGEKLKNLNGENFVQIQNPRITR